MKWSVWRDDVKHRDPRPWAAETSSGCCVKRRWFATWQEAFDYASACARGNWLFAELDSASGDLRAIPPWARPMVRLADEVSL